ncbi:hypothetical protein XELAEV_18027013mg [Xenopus laevis]|uniref:Uncharacterized protein n=1 Tax=Xenopus laevis TaxID=8355 RepID=A0A974CWU9_XENLA|nr:hypothetical protein XELAEV_18027013mg [Xenopus laevis]
MGGISQSVSAPAATVPSPSVAVTVTASLKGGPGEKEKAVVQEVSDFAKCSTYVCFEGPLGKHVKMEVKKKVWKGEYVEIFSLLPLERFNLDILDKKEEKKKEEEEKRRY